MTCTKPTFWTAKTRIRGRARKKSSLLLRKHDEHVTDQVENRCSCKNWKKKAFCCRWTRCADENGIGAFVFKRSREQQACWLLWCVICSTCSHTPPTCRHMLIVCRLDSDSQSRWSYHEINCQTRVQRLFAGHQFYGGQGTCWRWHRGALKSLICQQFTCMSNIKIYFHKYSENLWFFLF